MAGPNLPTNIGAGGTTTGHKTHSDTAHSYINKLDTTFLSPTDNNVLTYDSASGTYKPEVPVGSSIYVREIGDTSIPGGAPVGALLYTKQPIILKQWDGIGLADVSGIATTTVGFGDSPFSAVVGTVNYDEGPDTLDVSNAASIRNLSWDGFNRSEWAARWYFSTDAAGAGNSIIFEALDSGLSRLFTVTLNTSRQPQLRNQSDTSVFNGTALVATTKYRIEVAQTAAGSAKMTVYNLNGTVHTQSGVQSLGFSNAMNKLNWGQISTVAYGPGHFSHFLVQDSAAVPVGDWPPVVTV